MTGPEGEAYRLEAAPRVMSNNQLAIRDLTLHGLGLSVHVAAEIADELGTGRLVPVLPDWKLPVLAVTALMPSRVRQPAKVRLAVDALRAYLTALETSEPARRSPAPPSNGKRRAAAAGSRK